MTLSITENLFSNVNTISMPITSDSIFLIPILIGLGFIISCSQYIFKELKERQIFVLSKNQVKDHLAIAESIQDTSPTENPLIRKLSNISSPQLVGLSSLAFLAFGGTSFFVLEAHNQNLLQILKTSDLNNPSQVKSSKSQSSLSFQPKELFNTSTKEIKKITYLSPSFSKLKHSQNKKYTIIKPSNLQKFDF